jgi:transcriptional regulator with XRE-family HTH domain
MSDTPGSRLKKIRVFLRLSQGEFSKKLGVSQFTLSNYENGKRFPDSRFLEKLKDAADIDLNWLIKGEEASDGFSPGAPVDTEMKDFLYWYKELPIVRHSALAVLEDLKFKYPAIFKKSTDKKEEGGK